MAIETNLNQSPYFDDFDVDKNYHRVLFRPGYAVQARELTQLQTILQNQVEKFANEVMVDGTIVTGGGLITDNTNYVKMRDKDANNRVVLLGDFYSQGKIANVTITGITSGINAKLVAVKEGSESAGGNYLTAYCHYTDSGLDKQTKSFSDNEELDFKWSSGGSHKFFANSIATNATGKALKVNIEDGVIYHKGNFISMLAQSAIVGRYTTTPDAFIGLTTEETLVDSNQDSSLLDNASGATNYAAPGASRLRLQPKLTVHPYGFANTSSYFTVATVENGSIVQKNTDTIYSDVGNYVAERLYDTNGNFVVDPFNIRIREHLKIEGSLGRFVASEGGSTDKLICEVERGAGYVNGNKITLQAPRFLEFDKAANTIQKDSVVVGQSFGNYIKVNEVCGTWDIDNHGSITLYDSAAQALTNVNYSAQAVSGSATIGTAKIRGFQWDSGIAGTPTAVYRLYLFDIKMDEEKSFSSVKGVHRTDSFADIVLENNIAKLNESSLSRLVFGLGQRAAKSLTSSDNTHSTSWVYRRSEDTTFDVSGLSTISLTAPHTGGSETPWNTGNTITDVSESRNYIVVAKEDVTTAGMSGTVTCSGTAVSGSGTDFQSQYQVGDLIKIGTAAAVRIVSISSATLMAVSSSVTQGSATTHKKHFPKGYIFDLSENGTIISSGTPATVEIDLQQHTFASSFASTVYFNVNRTSSRHAGKVVHKNKFVHINTSSHTTAGAVGPWSLGITDAYKINAVYLGPTTSVSDSSTNVTNQFELISGQTDDLYDISYLALKADSDLDVTSKGIMVEFSYFTRDTSQGIGFYSVDSYPTSNTTPIETSKISWHEIPVFRSPTSGVTYDLRDHIDFRPTRLSTVTPAATGTVALAPTNPSITSDMDTSDASYYPTPDENFVCDSKFYLPRRDRVIITKGGTFQVSRGVPDLNPKTPNEISESMTLGILDIPPFPSLSPYLSKAVGRKDYSVNLSLENNRRYTMKDLRAVDQRIRSLEYYSTLNLLETSTKNKQIFSGSSGADRYKNGFFVDPMGSHVNSDTKNKYYRAAIDVNRGVMRPTFIRKDIALEKDVSLTSTGITKTGDILTLDYTHETLFEQPYASKLRNPVQELLFNWRGQVELDPPADNTPDITQNEEIQLDFSGFYTAIEELAEATGVTGSTSFGTWGASSGWVGNSMDFERTNITTTLESVSETISLGNTIESISSRAYMRGREIRITGVRMKPNTQLYAYFDDEKVSSYCTPTDSSFADTGVEGDQLETDDTGTVYAKFRIPDDENLRFRVGVRRFVLNDVEDPIVEKDLITTSAHGDFQSNPLDITMQGTDINLQIPQFSSETVIETKTLHKVSDGDRSWWDPIAQTFSVNISGSSIDGIYVTKVDLYFGKKDEKLPLTLQLRKVENGFPTETIVPYAIKTLTPSEIQISDDASLPTTFMFDTPVYLKNTTDYAFIVVPAGNSDQYALWTAEMGGMDVFRPDTLINKQPASGVLFSSSNDKTWNPIQSEDIKFTIHRADFSSSGTMYVENSPQEFFSVDNLSGSRFRVGETLRAESLLTFTHSQTLSVGQVLQSKGAYDGVPITNANFANGTIRQIVSDSGGTAIVKIDAMGDFQTTANINDLYSPGTSGTFGQTTSFVANTATGMVSFYDADNQKLHVDDSTASVAANKYLFANGWVRGLKSGAYCRVTSVDDLQMNLIVPKIPEILHAKTDIGWAIKTTSTSGVQSTKWESLSPGVENNFYDAEKQVYSRSNELLFNGGNRSVQIRANFESSKPQVSPVVDSTRMNGIVIGNIINNDSTNETNNYGNAKVRYISRRIELADGQDAEDIMVYLNAFKPHGTDIKVYAKILNAEDTDFESKDFTLLKQNTALSRFSEGFDGSDIRESEYTFESDDASGFLNSNDNNQAKLNNDNSGIVAYRSSEGSIFNGYKTFSIKIVTTSQSTALVPLIDDLRVIALQK